MWPAQERRYSRCAAIADVPVDALDDIRHVVINGFVHSPAGSPPPDLVLRGGGRTFWLSASAPLLRLTADHEGVSLSVAGRVGRMLVGSMVPPGPAGVSNGTVWA